MVLHPFIVIRYVCMMSTRKLFEIYNTEHLIAGQDNQLITYYLHVHYLLRTQQYSVNNTYNSSNKWCKLFSFPSFFLPFHMGWQVLWPTDDWKHMVAVGCELMSYRSRGKTEARQFRPPGPLQFEIRFQKQRRDLQILTLCYLVLQQRLY